jgi:hypothetical protein
MAIPRIVCVLIPTFCEAEFYDKNGMSLWVSWPLKLSLWLLGQRPVLIVTVLFIFLLLLVVGQAAETICCHPSIALFLMGACAILIKAWRALKIKTAQWKSMCDP